MLSARFTCAIWSEFQGKIDFQVHAYVEDGGESLNTPEGMENILHTISLEERER